MSDALIEKVARAIYAAEGGETPDFVLESTPDWEFHASAARAAIRVVVAECAKVADHLNGWGSDCGKGGHAEHIAAAIRRLAGDE